MKQSEKSIFDILKEIEQSQKDAVNEVLSQSNRDRSKPLTAEELEELINKTKTLIIQKEEHRRSAQNS